MRIELAKHAGYCFGVREAVNLALESAEQHGAVHMLGDIVHNEVVVAQLAAAGVKVVRSLEEAAGAPVLFRAHGTPADTWEAARAQSLEILDGTCPLVSKIHAEVRELAHEGRTIVIIGDHGHDEVVGIASQVEQPHVVSSPAEAEELPRMRRVGVVSQSTQMLENVAAILNVLCRKVVDLRFVNTICFPTRRNQEEIRELAERNDVVVIVGSFTSANTKRLASIGATINERTHQVATAADLRPEWFAEAESVGVSAGASTPDELIAAVVERIRVLAAG
ncbi:MAG: 4-hydroxy-3-methylbut-2-enyl diphosphate reductase [Planctomycetes bacterium]|nr:4-hydroxy-3-methylbut-2-enyl diphosphate reductase [Planctomycetota bacterium]